MRRLPAPMLPGWLEAELPFERYCLDVGGQRMHVMEQDGPGPTVLLLHGNPTWGYLYRKVAAALQSQPLRLIMPDLIGLGFSDKPTAGAHTIDNHARWMAELIEQLELDHYTLVVQDWGGAIGLCAAGEHLERVAGMVILNTAVGPPRPGFRPTLFHRFAHSAGASTVAFRALGFPQNALWLAQGDRSSLRGREGRAYRYPLRHFSDRIAPLALARMVPDGPGHPSIVALQRSQDAFERFGGPVEIVWGKADPILGRILSHLRRLKPEARVTETWAGHFLQEEVPEAIAAAIARVSGLTDARVAV